MKWQQVLVIIMVWSALLVGMVQEAQMDATTTIENLVVEQNSIAFSVESQEEVTSTVFPSFKGLQEPATIKIDGGFLQEGSRIRFLIDDQNIEVEENNPNIQISYLSPSITISFPARALLDVSDNQSKYLTYYMHTWENVDLSKGQNDVNVADGYVTRFFLPKEADKPFVDKLISLYNAEMGVVGVIDVRMLVELYAPYPNSIIKFQSQVLRSEYREPSTQSTNDNFPLIGVEGGN